MSTSPDVTSLSIQAMARQRPGVALRSAPNMLTLLRICLIPFLVAAVLDRHFGLAFALFAVAACTDAIDGLLARWLRQRTRLGEYLDPAADKLLLSTLFLVLTFQGLLDPRVTVLVFGRDLGMSLAAGIVYRMVNLRDFRPTLLGKANSFSQVVLIGLVLLGLFDPRPWVIVAGQIALASTVVLTVVSGFHYAWVVSKRIGEATEEEAMVQKSVTAAAQIAHRATAAPEEDAHVAIRR